MDFFMLHQQGWVPTAAKLLWSPDPKKHPTTSDVSNLILAIATLCEYLWIMNGHFRILKWRYVHVPYFGPYELWGDSLKFSLHRPYISGWWFQSLWRMWTSVGMMTFPTEWTVIKFHGSKPPTSMSMCYNGETIFLAIWIVGRFPEI